MAEPACVICGGVETHATAAQPEDWEYFVPTVRSLVLRRCVDCGSEFLWPRPDEQELAELYPLEYHAYHEDHGPVAALLVGLRARARARQLIKLAGREPVRLFDVGTGDCRHFEAMEKYGRFEFAGVELKPEIAERARARGYDVVQGSLETLELGAHAGRYDLVTMYHLVEHVIDPQRLFEQACALLRPGGYVLGQLPCRDSLEQRLFGRYWGGYHFPRHLQAFTRRGLDKQLTAAGLSEVGINGALHLQAGMSVQNWLLGKLGYRPTLKFGKTPLYSLILLGVAPYCALEYLAGGAGIMNFCARKPVPG